MKLLYFDDFKLGVLKNDTVVDDQCRRQGHPACRPGRLNQRPDRALRKLSSRDSRRPGERRRRAGVGRPIRPPLPRPINYRLHGGQLHGRRHAHRAGADQRLPQIADCDHRPGRHDGPAGHSGHDLRRRGRNRRSSSARRAQNVKRRRGDELRVRLHQLRRRLGARPAAPGHVFLPDEEAAKPSRRSAPDIVTADEIKDPQQVASQAVGQRRTEAELQHRRYGAQDPALHRMGESPSTR